MSLATILDCYGEDYPELFLDEVGDIRVAVAVRLGEVAASVASGQLSMWQLSEIFEGWMGITITFTDGYGLNDLVELWFEGGASDELGEEEEWPGPSLKTFFNALVDEMARYVAWQIGGRVGGFGPLSTGTAARGSRVRDDWARSTTRCGRRLRDRGVMSGRCADGVVPRSSHARRMAFILDDHGENYAARFLDEKGDIRKDVAVSLRASTVRITTGELSLWALDEECEGWMALAIAFMDGYGCDDLFSLWVDALDEFEQDQEWPDCALLVFFAAFAEEILGYLAWQVEGSVGTFRTYRNG